MFGLWWKCALTDVSRVSEPEKFVKYALCDVFTVQQSILNSIFQKVTWISTRVRDADVDISAIKSQSHNSLFFGIHRHPWCDVHDLYITWKHILFALESFRPVDLEYPYIYTIYLNASYSIKICWKWMRSSLFILYWKFSRLKRGHR